MNLWEHSAKNVIKKALTIHSLQISIALAKGRLNTAQLKIYSWEEWVKLLQKRPLVS